MEQPIIIGIAGAVVLLVIIGGLWIAGRKKITALATSHKGLESEMTALRQSLAESEELAARVDPLEKKVAAYENEAKTLQGRIGKLTATLKEETKKKAIMDDLAGRLAQSKILVEQLEMTAAKDKETISRLKQETRENKLMVEEQQTIIDKLKGVYTEG